MLLEGDIFGEQQLCTSLHQNISFTLAKLLCYKEGGFASRQATQTTLEDIMHICNGRDDLQEVVERIGVLIGQIPDPDQSGWREFQALNSLHLPEDHLQTMVMMGVQPLEALGMNRVSRAKFSQPCVITVFPALVAAPARAFHHCR